MFSPQDLTKKPNHGKEEYIKDSDTRRQIKI